MTRTLTVAVLVGIAIHPVPLLAQTSGPERRLVFEVASVKPNNSGRRLFGTFGPQPGGRWVMVNGTVRALINFAYAPGQTEITRLPEWADDERYDVIAKASRQATLSEMRSMVRSLLADRFGLLTHDEIQERDTYWLTVASDGSLGPDLRRLDIDCDALSDDVLSGRIALADVGSAGNGLRLCSTQTSTRWTSTGSIRTAKSGGRRIDVLAVLVAGAVGRPVMDRTGLEGFYEYALEYREDSLTADPGNALSDAPSIFTALEEQLGLRLQPQRDQVPVLVVDRLERPSED